MTQNSENLLTPPISHEAQQDMVKHLQRLADQFRAHADAWQAKYEETTTEVIELRSKLKRTKWIHLAYYLAGGICIPLAEILLRPLIRWLQQQ